jgi:hypothetical protein
VRNRASQPRYTGGSNEAGASVQRWRPPADSSDDAPVRIRAAVFFDGTLNNRTNVELGQQRVFRGDSYRNNFTNIAILEKYHQPNCEYDISFATYVEGVGTTDGEGDTKIAAALGIWKTGLLDKVQVAVTKIINRIVQKTKQGTTIDCIHLDSFGFSRGAAAARNFVYQTLCEEETLKSKLVGMGYTVNDVRVKFVGLFDTVASFGIDHQNDTAQLHLDAIMLADYVVQLAAADEHRKNFPLTNVESAPQGQQFFLPGAHSDIGGGYADEVDEIDLRLTGLKGLLGISKDDKAVLSKERHWLLDSGWYHEMEIQDTNRGDLKVTRRGISNHYSRIPLKIMTHHANERGVNFKESLISDHKIPEHLSEVEGLLLSSPAFLPEYWIKSRTDIMKRLRHDYLHFSAYYGSTMGCHEPKFTGDDPIRGHRKRDIYDG